MILWLVSPDKKVREPIEYLKYKEAKALEGRIREIAGKHGVKVVDPAK